MTIAGYSNVAAARTTFETLAYNALEQERDSGAWKALAARKEGGDSQIYVSILNGATPTWEKQQGSRAFGGFRQMYKPITQALYHKSMELDRRWVIYDKSGAVANRISTFIRNDGYPWDKLVFDCLARNEICADGVALISNAHPYGENGSTWSNATSDPLDHNSFDAAVAAMRSLKDEFGEPLSLMPDTLIVSPSDARMALDIADADVRPVEVGTVGATSITNTYKGLVTVIVTSRMKDGDWVIVDSRYPAIDLVVWRDPTVHIADDMNGSERMRNDKFLYSIEADAGVGAVQPYGIYGKIS